LTFWSAYLAVVAPLVIVMAFAMWRPRWWQWAFLLVGPFCTTLAAAEVPGVGQVGWPASIGVAYAFLLVPAVLPWRRRWARWAISAIVLLDCGFLAAAAGFGLPSLVYLGLPALLSLAVLATLLVSTLVERRTDPAMSRAGQRTDRS